MKDYDLMGKGYADQGGAVSAATAPETNRYSEESITQKLDSAGFGITIVVLAVIISVFALGLYLGGKAANNNIKMLKAEMNDIRVQLLKNPNSVVIVKGTIAEMINFKPRKGDLDLRKVACGDRGN